MEKFSFKDVKRKRMTKPVKIAFISRAGKRISFRHTRKVTKPIKIAFLGKAPRRRF